MIRTGVSHQKDWLAAQGTDLVWKSQIHRVLLGSRGRLIRQLSVGVLIVKRQKATVKMTEGKNKNCFVIAPIGEQVSETRRRSDQVLRHIIQPVAEECGYKVTRADKMEKPGLITSQIIQRITEDDLVVADLTGYNPNVFYELAIRHAIRKPVIHMISEGEKIPFDVSNSRTIYFNHRDLDSVFDSKQKMTDQIRYLEKNPDDIETPVSVAIDIESMKSSKDPAIKSSAEIISILQDLMYEVMSLKDNQKRRKSTFDEMQESYININPKTLAALRKKITEEDLLKIKENYDRALSAAIKNPKNIK